MLGFRTRQQEPVKSAYDLHSAETHRILRWISLNTHRFPSAGPEDFYDELNYTMEYQKRWGQAVITLAAEQGVTLTHTKWSEYVYI